MSRERGSIVWRSITIPEHVGRCLRRFLETAEYGEPYSTAEACKAWERLKAAYYACPEAIRMQLPEIPWPQCLPDEVIERARDLADLYRKRTAEERAPLLAALHCVAPLTDLQLFGVLSEELRPPPPSATRATVHPIAEAAATKKSAKKRPRK